MLFSVEDGPNETNRYSVADSANAKREVFSAKAEKHILYVNAIFRSKNLIDF